MDTLTLHSDKELLLCDVRKAADEKEQIQAKKEGLLEDIGVLDKEFEKRLDFINVLDKHKAILYKLLSMIPVAREFARLVEEKRDEITPENRICTLEQAEVYMQVVENFMEEMQTPENAGDNHLMYRTQNEEHVTSR